VGGGGGWGGGGGGWGGWGGVGSLLTFDIPQTALVATLDTYDFIFESSFMISFGILSQRISL
jgi:hypothetical protein